MHIHIINGPNLNLLGKREPEIYGTLSFDTYLQYLQKTFPTHRITYFQSNSEGALIDALHSTQADGILLNAAAYTHTSIAIRDAITCIKPPVIEIHLSNIYAREPFRAQSLLASVCTGSICGLGLMGYELGLSYLLASEENKLSK